ncbi:MAG: helix-turn-helix domain-containing protein [Rhodospirillales bacterium]
MHTIGEASRMSGVHIETIRYYERCGVLPAPTRAANGRRFYRQADIGRLCFIKRCRDLGFGLSDVTALLALAEGEETDCNAAQAVADRHLRKIRTRIEDLRQLERALAELTGNCATGSAHCPMLNELMLARAKDIPDER